MSTVQHEVDERTNLISSNKFELLLFRLGVDTVNDRSELFGINVFKVREIVAMPEITAVAGALPHNLGVVNLRGQIIPVIDLPSVVGRTPKSGLNIMLVTEFARSTQGFAVESVEEIVRLDWSHVLSAESSAAGGGLVTSIARLDGDAEDTRLAQVLDVEQILRQIAPKGNKDVDSETIGAKLRMKPGSVIMAADDSAVARGLIGQALDAIGAPYIMSKTGKECWDKLQAMQATAVAEGKSLKDKVALVLTDLEMPEMDGFTLTRNIKQDDRFKDLPVIIHSSLSGTTNEDHVRSVGADAYVAKFVAEELAATIREVIVN
ncbi:chemotaxis protein CheV [Undibacterium sp. LX40W]|uniref:Chemotaxis protein CheV n=1 Tax=Undibacterium nitidum TaxID=2762298 RepID=A0A923KRY5_9BURK|nr:MULTISPECIES: chemotaxis protein [Undibacterium]MBC3879782.1 chemotaxis protein CheV [Undibacterium nitidum]MBC3891482.1 chemotaxis protein CheV [Undibacterium sp. LX40W]